MPSGPNHRITSLNTAARLVRRSLPDAYGLSWERQIKTDAARYGVRRDTQMTRVIVRRLETIMRKPVALFGRCVAPEPAIAHFPDFFTRDRMTVLVVAAFFIIPAMDKRQRD